MICPRCKREAVGWPLYRGDRCSPEYWVNCIREPEDIQKALDKPKKPKKRKVQPEALGDA